MENYTAVNSEDILKSKNVVCFGAQDYFRENISKIKDSINVKFVFPDGNYNKESVKKYVLLDNMSSLKKLDNPYVLIARGAGEKIRIIAENLRRLNIPFSHLDFYSTNYIRVHYLKALGVYDFIDLNNNHVTIDPQISDKVIIKKENATNCTVNLGKVKVQTNLGIQIMGNMAKCRICSNSTFVETQIVINTNGYVEVGEDCMFSHGIRISQSDQHHIFDLETHKRINHAKPVKIGNHVWVGRECELLGGATIGNNSIVGAKSVTSSSFGNNVVLAGSPARVIREKVIWARDVLKSNDYQTYDECEDKAGLKYLD